MMRFDIMMISSVVDSPFIIPIGIQSKAVTVWRSVRKLYSVTRHVTYVSTPARMLESSSLYFLVSYLCLEIVL